MELEKGIIEMLLLKVKYRSTMCDYWEGRSKTYRSQNYLDEVDRCINCWKIFCEDKELLEASERLSDDSDCPGCSGCSDCQEGENNSEDENRDETDPQDEIDSNNSSMSEDEPVEIIEEAKQDSNTQVNEETESKIKAYCQICQDDLDLESNLMCPYCSQTWCEICIKGSLRQSKACPNWRKPIKSASKLIKNYFLASTITEIAKNTAKRSFKSCKIHNRNCELFCKNWNEAICSSCSISPSHSQHNIINIEEKVKEENEETSLSVSRLQNKIDSAKSTIVKIDNEEEKEKKRFVNIRNKVVSFLNHRTKDLLKLVKHNYNKKTKPTKNKLKKAEAHVEKINKLIDSKNPSKLEELYKLKKEWARFKNIICQPKGSNIDNSSDWDLVTYIDNFENHIFTISYENLCSADDFMIKVTNNLILTFTKLPSDSFGRKITVDSGLDENHKQDYKIKVVNQPSMAEITQQPDKDGEFSTFLLFIKPPTSCLELSIEIIYFRRDSEQACQSYFDEFIYEATNIIDEELKNNSYG